MGCAPQSRTPAPPEVSGPLDPAAKPNPRARPSPNEPLPRMRLPRARRIPTAIRVNHPPGPERAADPGRLGANRRPRPERAADPGRLGANRRPRPEPVAGSPPTRSFGSPQGEKIAKPHIDLRHRLRIHDSGDVDDPFARYGPRLLGHGVHRTTRNELRPPPPQSNPPHGRLRTDGFARATPRQCVGKQMPPRRCRRATSIYGTKPSRLWFSAKCRQITPTAHPLSGPIRSELGPKVTGLPRPRC